MGYEIYEDRLVGTESGVSSEAFKSGGKSYHALVSGDRGDILKLRTGEDDYVTLRTRRNEEGQRTATVEMPEVIDAWLTVKRLSGEPARLLSPGLGDEEQEQIAEVIERACAVVAMPEAMATELRAATLRLMSLARREVVPVASVDPEDFDVAIRTWRSELVNGAGKDPVTRQNTGLHEPLTCLHYIDAWQSARATVLGAILPADKAVKAALEKERLESTSSGLLT